MFSLFLFGMGTAVTAAATEDERGNDLMGTKSFLSLSSKLSSFWWGRWVWMGGFFFGLICIKFVALSMRAHEEVDWLFARLEVGLLVGTRQGVVGGGAGEGVCRYWFLTSCYVAG